MKLNNFKLCYCDDTAITSTPKTINEIEKSGYNIIEAAVPGNFELDLVNAGILPKDIYFGTNILKVQQYENTHVWYFTTFNKTEAEDETYLLFNGVDTSARVYIDGNKTAEFENMLIPHEINISDLSNGTHELVVHIIPARQYVKNQPKWESCHTNKYNYDSLFIRKAPYMYGWDIMPRTVSIGLHKYVELITRPKERIENIKINLLKHLNNGTHNEIMVKLDCLLAGNFTDYKLMVEGSCKDHHFKKEQNIFNQTTDIRIILDKVYLWYPKNYGEQNLYDIKITLLRNNNVIDEQNIRHGFRKVSLDRTSTAGKDGKFQFIVNDKKIFALGTNFVPTDAFPSRHKDYTPRALKLTDEIGCNMIRCWGGNVYENEDFYNFCDEHGILIWQDFSMACGRYPQTEKFCSLLDEEVKCVAKKLYNHPCIALYSGDNECDCSYIWDGTFYDGAPKDSLNPNDNILTREIIPKALKSIDVFTPYLPSSPYYDQMAVSSGEPLSEDHLWGPRDYFKGEYYKNSVCHFASETGYHGCPSAKSLKKFISEDELYNIGDEKLCTSPDWIVHSACPEADSSAPYAYRIPLMTSQVIRLFGYYSKDLNEYALQSQISQAEAMKYFIEKFRIGKPYRSGIIWWNIIDGWPQISDAVVDYYGEKKLAYHYIYNSQKPFAIMIDEPDDEGNLQVVATNDSQKDIKFNYEIIDILNGEILLSGGSLVSANGIEKIGKISKSKARFIGIKWNGDVSGINHYVVDLGDTITLAEYDSVLDFLNLKNSR